MKVAVFSCLAGICCSGAPRNFDIPICYTVTKAFAFDRLVGCDALGLRDNWTEISLDAFSQSLESLDDGLTETCHICLDDLFRNGSLDFCKLGCRQWVHHDCQRQWMRKSRFPPRCSHCRCEWLDIPSALQEQLDVDNVTEWAATLHRMVVSIVDVSIEHRRILRSGRLDDAMVNRILMGYVCEGFGNTSLPLSTGSSISEVFQSRERLEAFLRISICERPCGIGAVNLAPPRTALLEVALFAGRHKILATMRRVISYYLVCSAVMGTLHLAHVCYLRYCFQPGE
ncbi:MAG: hypothetical protein SGCHY_003559 [Lobulomycetales sp.]